MRPHKVWVDDVFYFAEDEISLLCLLDEILGRLMSVGLFVAAHKCTFFARELVWCGKVYSDSVVSHDPCLLYTSPSPRDGLLSRMPSSA